MMTTRKKRKVRSLPLPQSLSRLMICIAWPDLRFCPGVEKIKSMAWTMRALYNRAAVRDYRIMLMREKCVAKGPLAKTVELRLKGMVHPL